MKYDMGCKNRRKAVKAKSLVLRAISVALDKKKRIRDKIEW